MNEQVFAVRLHLVQRSCAEITVTAETPGDAYVMAERMARSNAVQFCAEDEDVQIASVIPSNAEPITKGKERSR